MRALPIDECVLARARKIAAALRTMVPGEGVIEQKSGRRHYVTDGRTAYRALPRHWPQYVRRGPAELGWSCAIDLGGNDWFVIPVELDVGSLYRTRSLVITDTFGIRTLIKSSSELGAPYSTWRMFQHSYLRGSGFTVPASNLFFLSPSLLKSLEGQPIEEVLFLRDEMSNLAWAVERLIESPANARSTDLKLTWNRNGGTNQILRFRLRQHPKRCVIVFQRKSPITGFH
jgi:hypothetical protein